MNKVKPARFKNVCISKKELNILRPRQPVPPVDFVKQINLPTKSNVLPNIDLTLTPYLIDPIKELSNYSTEIIIIIAPTQSGKTVVLQTAIAWSIDQDPGPLLYVYPTEKDAKKSLNEKIIQMIYSTPCLKKRIRRVKDVSKEGINLDNMTIYPAWSNSPGTMSNLPMKRVIWDEVRLMSLTIGRESNAIKLGADRMTSFCDLGISQGIMVSSPSVEGDILFQQLSVPGTIELWWHVPCLKCGKYQKLDFFDNIQKPRIEQTGATCLCKFCKEPFSDLNYKREWNMRGVFAPADSEIGQDGKVHGLELSKYPRKAYRWDSLVSPFRSFAQIWNEFLNTKDKLHDYKNFIQAWLAQFWKERESKNSIESLSKWKGNYLITQVDSKTKVLTGGIDTQDVCLYYTVYGHGGNGESWLVDEGKIECDINITDEEDLRVLVYSHISNKTYIDDNGVEWKIALIAWDSGGHRTKEVYSAARKLRNVVAIKGKNNQSRSVIFSKVEKLFTIRTIEYLDEIEETYEKGLGHFPKNVSEEFLIQWINKSRVVRLNKKTGEKKVEWITFGADHLKDASAYSCCCLDIPIKGIGVIRARLRDINFKYNPAAFIARQMPKEDMRDADGSVDDMTQHDRVERSKNDFTDGEEYTW